MHFRLCVNAALVGVYVQILEAILSFCFLNFVTFFYEKRHALEVKPTWFVLPKFFIRALLAFFYFIREVYSSLYFGIEAPLDLVSS
jgi:hypothetical protein